MEIANLEDTPIGIKGCVPARGQLGEEEVEDDDCEEALDEAFGAGASDAAGAGAAGETFVAGDQADGGAEEDAFADAFEDLPMLDGAAGVFPEGFVGNGQGFDGDEPSAGDAEDVAVDGEHGGEEKAGDESGDDEIADRIGAHDAQGVELFGDVHGSQLGGEGSANPAGEHDGGHDGADLFNDGEGDEAAEAIFLAESFELGVGFDGHHHADECADDADDGDGFDADLVELGNQQTEIFSGEGGGGGEAEDLRAILRELAEGGDRDVGSSADGFDKRNRHGGDHTNGLAARQTWLRRRSQNREINLCKESGDSDPSELFPNRLEFT